MAVCPAPVLLCDSRRLPVMPVVALTIVLYAEASLVDPGLLTALIWKKYCVFAIKLFTVKFESVIGEAVLMSTKLIPSVLCCS